MIPVDYLLIIGGTLAFLAVFVEIQVYKLVKKSGRQSIISFIFVGIKFVAIIMTVIVGIRNVKSKSDQELPLFQFKSICT